jgi:two-component system response regulator YesN
MRLMIDWRSHGFEMCGEAVSAQDALLLVDSLHPHLLITDVRMPGMLGTDLAAIVRHYHPEIVILLFSVLKDFSFAQSAIRSGVFDYLVKPIDPDEVHRALCRVKAELDERVRMESENAGRGGLFRDQVLRHLAFGDDSPENLMRAEVLLDLKHNDPCYAALMAGNVDILPENTKHLIDAFGAIPFQLAPNQYGLRFRQIELDLAFLERLRRDFPETSDLRLSVGRVYRGAEGFVRSLREALDAQGALFEPHHRLRLYRPIDAETAEWLAGLPIQRLRDALVDRDPDALEALLSDTMRQAADTSPNLFALRCMAASLDAICPAAWINEDGACLKPLWQEESPSRDAWFLAFATVLRQLHSANGHQRTEDWPAPVKTAISIIRTRYSEPLSMGFIAGSLGMNPAYLGQQVRRHVGVTFHRLLLDTRMERASVLLRQTALSVSEIAREVGFRDVEYFSQQFRGRVGMSPIAYRCAGLSKEESHA